MILATVVLALGACAPTEPPPSRPVGVVILPAAGAADSAAYSAVAAVEVEDPDDLCRASSLQWLVGRDRSEIPVPVDISNRRVACTTCPRTEAHSPYLLNILYDARTNRVTEVSCG